MPEIEPIVTTLSIEHHDAYAEARRLTKRIRRYNELVRRGIENDEYWELREEMVEIGQVKE